MPRLCWAFLFHLLLYDTPSGVPAGGFGVWMGKRAAFSGGLLCIHPPPQLRGDKKAGMGG